MHLLVRGIQQLDHLILLACQDLRCASHPDLLQHSTSYSDGLAS